MTKNLKMPLIIATCSSMIYASGYRIPEQSFASVAKSGANFASANGADASYYNPANMAFMDDKSSLELGLTYINLPSVDYADNLSSQLNSSSKVENFLAPSTFYVSPKIGENWRFGASFAVPGGLAKRWDDAYAKAYSKKFSLKILELNPAVSYKVSEQFALAFGARAVYIEGVVQSDGGGARVRDLEGDSVDYGYNLALTYKPIKPLSLVATYRSNVDLGIEGDATLANGAYDGFASVKIPLPAVLDLAIAYDFGKTNVEFVYERTYWSKYKELDFDYSQDLTQTPLAAFDVPVQKQWKDVNAYRIGISHQATDKLNLLAGFAYDENPANGDYLGFELPDSDALLFSFGVSYKISPNSKIGFSYLYDKKKKRNVNNRQDQTNPSTGLNGTFENASAHLVNLSYMYEF